MRQFLQCVCNIFISPGWHARRLLYDICLLQLCHRTGARIVGEWRFIISLLSFDTCLIVEVKLVWVAARALPSSPKKTPCSSNLTLLTMNLASNARKQKSPLSLWPSSHVNVSDLANSLSCRKGTRSKPFSRGACAITLRDTGGVCQADLLGEIQFRRVI